MWKIFRSQGKYLRSRDPVSPPSSRRNPSRGQLGGSGHPSAQWYFRWTFTSLRLLIHWTLDQKELYKLGCAVTFSFCIFLQCVQCPETRGTVRALGDWSAEIS